MQLTYTASITDEMIADAEALVGSRLRIEQWNHEATLDTIRHYAWGMGDDNPLFCDEEYASSGRFGTIVAPPSFLHSVYSGDIGIGFPGVQPVGAGYKFEFFEWVKRGDRIRAEAKVGPIEVHDGRQVDRFVLQTTETDFVRQDGVVVARLQGSCFRVPRRLAAGGLRYDKREPHIYSEAELDDIRIAALNELVRGSESRYWEDVEVGDQVPPVVKGPIDLIAMISYYGGRLGSPGMKGVEMAWKYRDYALHNPAKLPNNYDVSFFAESVQPGLGHVLGGVADQVGFPGAYANGGQRASWMAHAVTNWMGDDGDLTRLHIKLRRPDVFGDTVFCSGVVEAKPESGITELRISARNQLDEVTMEGSALVRLPVRSAE